MANTPYQRWYQEVDQIVLRKVGLHVDELPDYTDLGALYACDVTPVDAAQCVFQDQEVEW